jgi:hypothetical protein
MRSISATGLRSKDSIVDEVAAMTATYVDDPGTAARLPKTQLRSTTNRTTPPNTLAIATADDSCSAVGSPTTAPRTRSTAEEYTA